MRKIFKHFLIQLYYIITINFLHISYASSITINNGETWNYVSSGANPNNYTFTGASTAITMNGGTLGSATGSKTSLSGTMTFTADSFISNRILLKDTITGNSHILTYVGINSLDISTSFTSLSALRVNSGDLRVSNTAQIPNIILNGGTFYRVGPTELTLTQNLTLTANSSLNFGTSTFTLQCGTIVAQGYILTLIGNGGTLAIDADTTTMGLIIPSGTTVSLSRDITLSSLTNNGTSNITYNGYSITITPYAPQTDFSHDSSPGTLTIGYTQTRKATQDFTWEGTLTVNDDFSLQPDGHTITLSAALVVATPKVLTLSGSSGTVELNTDARNFSEIIADAGTTLKLMNAPKIISKITNNGTLHLNGQNLYLTGTGSSLGSVVRTGNEEIYFGDNSAEHVENITLNTTLTTPINIENGNTVVVNSSITLPPLIVQGTVNVP